jgi:hypothetical protein
MPLRNRLKCRQASVAEKNALQRATRGLQLTAPCTCFFTHFSLNFFEIILKKIYISTSNTE